MHNFLNCHIVNEGQYYFGFRAEDTEDKSQSD